MILTFKLDLDSVAMNKRVKKLLSGHTDRHTYRANSLTWTTKVVDKYNNMYEVELLNMVTALYVTITAQ